MDERIKDSPLRSQAGPLPADMASMLQLTPDIHYIYDIAGHRNTFVSRSVERVLGYSGEEICRMGEHLLLTLIHPEDLKTYQRETRLLYAAATDKEPLKQQYRMRRKSGDWLWFDCTEFIYRRSPDGSPESIFGVAHNITERRGMEINLRIAEERLRLAMEVSRQGWFELNLQTGKTEVSKEYAQILGYEPAAFNTNLQDWIDGLHPDDRDRVLKTFGETVATGETGTMEYRRRAKDGSWRWIHSIGKVIEHDADHKPLRMIGTHADISSRKQAEQQTRDSEEKFRSIYEHIGIGVALIGKDMEILSINPQMRTWFPQIDSGKRALCYRSFNTPPREKICDYCPTVLTLQDGHVHRAVTETPTPEGIRHYQVISTPLLAGDGTIAAAIEMVEDITEHKKTVDLLHESEKKFRTIIDVSPVPYAMNDEQQNITYLNKAFNSAFGYTLEDIPTLGDWFAQAYPDPEYRRRIAAEWQQRLEKAKTTGTGFEPLEVVICRKDGAIRTVLVSAASLGTSFEGTHLVILIDITDRKEAEEQHRLNAQFIRSILDTVDEGFIVVGRDYRILTVNRAYCAQVGGDSESIVGRPCYEVTHRSSRPCYEEGEQCATRQAFETGTAQASLHRHKDAGGNLIYVETKAFPVKDASGITTAVIETINNITEKYLLEEERLKTQKLESIGTLAGGIAHDFNNLLQGVFGYISMAKITHDQKERSLAMLDQAEEALHMSVNLTTQLLTFAKGGKPVKKLIRLRNTIENAAKFALSGAQTDYRLDMVPDLWSVEADAGQLAQVIQNIVLNANEAMAGRGTITITARNVDTSSPASPRLPGSGRFVRIDILDTGTGISGQNLAKVFDPYFTTKQKGSGLGLATSYSIIKNHGGVIEVASELNKGTVFTLYLPASDGVQTETPLAETSAGTRKGKILLMDDEPLVRSVAAEMIAALGHAVVAAGDGAEALELFRRARDAEASFDLVILDLTVKGGMGGEEAVAKIRELEPGAVAVVSSGYADSPVVASFRDYGFSAALNKPYRIDSLQQCFDSLIH